MFDCLEDRRRFEFFREGVDFPGLFRFSWRGVDFFASLDEVETDLSEHKEIMEVALSGIGNECFQQKN